MSLAAHRRWTVAFDTPAISAMFRKLRRPSVAGGVTALSSILRHPCRAEHDDFRPLPVAYSNRRRFNPPLQLAALFGIHCCLARHFSPRHGVAAACPKPPII